MDEMLANKIDEIMEGWDRNYDYCQNNHTMNTYLALKITEAGYRLEPYPNGKSKDQLMAQTSAVQANLDRASILLHEVYTLTFKGKPITMETASAIAAFLKELAKDSTGETG